MEKHPDKIKRFFLMLLAWVVAVTAIIGGSIFYNSYQGSQYEAQAVPYLKEVVPIISEWNADKIRELMAEENLAMIPEGNFAKAMNLFSKLGSLTAVKEPKFEEVVDDERDPTKPRKLVTYKVPVTFTNGDAEYTIQLIDRGDHLQLFNFNISSETLTGPAPQ